MNNKLGIVITTYNRPEYLSRCLESLKRAAIPEDVKIIICDDSSTDPQTIKLICDSGYELVINDVREGIALNLLQGFNILFDSGCDVLMNLDSDAFVRNDFIERILELPDYRSIKTGFNCNTKNADGSERHIVCESSDTWNMKKSVGGINMCFSADVYLSYLRDVLIYSSEKKLNWDHQACIKMGGAISTVPSVIQHIGFDSSMNHNEAPDVANDFKPLSLSNVTLIGVDCLHLGRLLKAANISEENIKFGSVKMLSSMPSNDPRVIPIEAISTKEDYSKFMMKELNKYIDTDYALIIQHDGYVLNYKAWDNNYFEYDYIGAHWWYEDGKNVGNGGFCLRSKKLIEILATDDNIKKYHPEDHHICRTYRAELEKKYGIKFAPEHVAAKFSVEGHFKKINYNDQFGFHGGNVMNIEKSSRTFVINQFRGLGDILFCIPLVRKWIDEGINIIWPVIPEYLSIQKHFPDIEFVDMNSLIINYDRTGFYETQYGKMIPLRFADSITKVNYKYCMKSKYDLFGAPLDLWRSLKWERDNVAENILFYDILGLKDGEEFTLVNKNFRTDRTGRVNIPDVAGTVINMQPLKGFTMLDWGLVIERASAIHTVGTSINYILEVMDTKAEIHLYVRRPEEKDFSYYDYLLKKEYIFHL